MDFFSLARLTTTARKLKSILQRVRQSALGDELVALLEISQAQDILKIVKQHIGTTNRKHHKARTLPMPKAADSHACSDPAKLPDQWIDYFGAMEGVTHINDLTQRALWLENLAQFRQDELQLQPWDVPSLTDLEIASELCCACPTTVARHLYGALLKLVYHGQETLIHKGGTLAPAFKGKGSPLDVSGYRSLLISSHLGKSLHRTVRQTQASLLENYMCPQQLGGRRHVPVTLAP